MLLHTISLTGNDLLSFNKNVIIQAKQTESIHH